MLDLIDSAVHLARGKLCDASKIVLEGASAGGLLVLGAAVLAPELFAGVIADVPFCQVLSAMLDKSLPLTCQELEEWGDPTDTAVREYMLQYSPYDLLQQGRRYPPVLLSGATSDKQVLFHEPLMFGKKLEVERILLMVLFSFVLMKLFSQSCHPQNVAVTFIEADFGHGGCPQRFGGLNELARGLGFAIWAIENPWRQVVLFPTSFEATRYAERCQDLLAQNDFIRAQSDEVTAELEAVKKQLAKALMQLKKP